MTTYNNVFNGNFVQPSSVSYRNIVLNADVQLTWPTTYLDDAANNVAAQVMTVQANAGVPTTVALGLNPVGTTAGSGVVVITGPFNSSIQNGSTVTIAGSTAVDTITALEINIFTNATVLSANTFSYQTGGNAVNTVNGGGNAVTVTYNLFTSITLPDATQVANGQPLTFVNNGANTFAVYDFSGTFLTFINVTQTFDLILMDNSTVGGTWLVSQRGATTAQANAQSLTGNGLINIFNRLGTNFPSKIVAGDYTSVLADRAALLVWTGGAGTINLPSVNVPTPAGFFVSVNNNGTGIVNVTTTDGSTIDSLATFGLSPGDSSYFIFNLPNWNTLGFGKETTFQVNALSLIIAAGGTFNLTGQQASRLVQTYTGNLGADAIVTFPAAPGQWYVSNATTGAHTVTLQLFGVGGGFQIAQGAKVIVYSDGVNLYQTPTTALTATFAPGAVGAPTIKFTNSNTTGFYSFADGDFGFSSGGTLSLDLAGYGLGVKAGGKVRYYNNANTQYVSLGAQPGLAATREFLLPSNDATVANQIMVSNAALQLSFTAASYPNGTTINQLLYSSAANTVTGLATANNGVLVTGAGGIPSIGNTLPGPVQLNITTIGTIATGVWNATPITVPFGGTGRNTLTTAFGTLCAGTTATNPIQTVAPGTAGQLLTSNGVAALPTYQTLVNQGNIPAVRANFSNMGVANPTINGGVGVNTITRTGVGVYAIVYTNPFVTNLPVVIPSVYNIGVPLVAYTLTEANNSCQIAVYNLAGVQVDPSGLNLLVIGT